MSDALRIRSGPFGRVALLDMDRSLVRHAHPHCHVLLKVDGADTGMLVGDRVAHLTDDTAILINAWTPHAYVHDARKPRTLILALYVEPAWLAEFRPNWVCSGSANFFDAPTGTITAEIRRMTVDLAQAMVHAPTARAEHERLLGALMIAMIERFAAWRSIGGNLRDAARQQSVDWRIRRAITAIRDEPGGFDSVDRLADIAGMSRANFFRVFEASTGVTPRVFLNVVRLEQAVHQALHSQTAFCDLSTRLGFSDPAHFTRFFRDHAGVTPSRFRSVARMGTTAASANL